MTISSILIAFLMLASVAEAEPAAKALCSRLEQHLQSLKSLEIRYEANDEGSEGETISGRIIWQKPNRFLHETPSWTLCETDGEQWRFLKDQLTLIRETAPEKSEWLPENVLFHASSGFEPDTLTVNSDGNRVVLLRSRDASVPGEGLLVFPRVGIQPVSVQFRTADGAQTIYRIMDWVENEPPDSAIFEPPAVPVENIIDFRSAGKRD